jgi:hypothetical protein
LNTDSNTEKRHVMGAEAKLLLQRGAGTALELRPVAVLPRVEEEQLGEVTDPATEARLAASIWAIAPDCRTGPKCSGNH